VGRYLTQVARFANCVPVAGAIEYHGADGRVMTLALLQAYVPNQGDAWDYTLGYLDRVLSEQRDSPEGDAVPDHGAFLKLTRVLGQRTAELHLAFARSKGDAAFDPEPLSAADRTAFRDTAAVEARRSFDMLRERMSGLPPEAQQDAERLLAREAALLQRIESFPTETAGPAAIKSRFHGDYHLGQVLVSRNDFVIIDFEGEPARSFTERRAKTSPLRDVAGMLRSFNYARWSSLKRNAQNPEELLRLDSAASDWELQVRKAFLGGYADTLAVAGAPPPEPELLSLFEIDKAMYELRYELNNRVDWLQVPMQGLQALATADGTSIARGDAA